MRSTAGAQTNAVDHALTYNSHAAMELNGFQMNREEDTTEKAYNELKTKQALDVYQVNIEKMKMDDAENQSKVLFA